ncbi:MAG: FAD-dependent oxidoreductase [Aulosira sp. ZfuCHP01]|nr:FAD-dependent oxidoreductase [Aulosira sp. DedVER01a]MDZ8050913.1 FAD-dependent oxidoreductase [Aulosira sp. ZfuCHP01]
MKDSFSGTPCCFNLWIVFLSIDARFLNLSNQVAPGQIRRFQDPMAKPWQRIHFAGEHTVIASGGTESALESAERVSSKILNRVLLRSDRSL